MAWGCVLSKGFNLGTVWLKVLPSFRGFDRAAQQAAREAQAAYDREEAKNAPRRERDAEQQGRREGEARARGDREARRKNASEAIRGAKEQGRREGEAHAKAARDARGQVSLQEAVEERRAAKREHARRLREMREMAREQELLEARLAARLKRISPDPAGVRQQDRAARASRAREREEARRPLEEHVRLAKKAEAELRQAEKAVQDAHQTVGEATQRRAERLLARQEESRANIRRAEERLAAAQGSLRDTEKEAARTGELWERGGVRSAVGRRVRSEEARRLQKELEQARTRIGDLEEYLDKERGAVARRSRKISALERDYRREFGGALGAERRDSVGAARGAQPTPLQEAEAERAGARLAEAETRGRRKVLEREARREARRREVEAYEVERRARRAAQRARRRELTLEHRGRLTVEEGRNLRAPARPGGADSLDALRSLLVGVQRAQQEERRERRGVRAEGRERLVRARAEQDVRAGRLPFTGAWDRAAQRAADPLGWRAFTRTSLSRERGALWGRAQGFVDYKLRDALDRVRLHLGRTNVELPRLSGALRGVRATLFRASDGVRGSMQTVGGQGASLMGGLRSRWRMFDASKTDPWEYDHAVRSQMRAAAQALPTYSDLEVRADTTGAKAKIMELHAMLRTIADPEITPDVDSGEAMREMGRIHAAARALDALNLRGKAGSGVREAARELTVLDNRLAAIGARSNLVRNTLHGLRHSLLNSAAAARGFSMPIMVVLALLPVLVPLLMTVGAQLMAVATSALSAATAVGVLALAFSGVRKAVGALNSLDDAKFLASRRPASGAGATPAQGAVSSAADAARDLERANKRLADSERNLAQAQRRAREAQEALTEARRDARRELEDMRNALRSGELSEREAQYALEDTRKETVRTRRNPEASRREKDRAELRLEIAQQDFVELQLRNVRLREDYARLAPLGVEGSARVTAARQAVEDAHYGVADAQWGLREAALVPSAEAAAAGLGAVAAAADPLQGELDQLALAMSKLSPAAQEFAHYLHGLKPVGREIRWAAQEGVLPGVQSGLERVVGTYAEPVEDFVGRYGRQWGGIADRAGSYLAQPDVQAHYAKFFDYTQRYTELFASTFSNFSTGMQGVLEQLFPFTEEFGRQLDGLSARFAEWAQSPEGQGDMARLFDFISRISPDVWGIIGNVFEIIGKTIEGLSPDIEKWLAALNDFLDRVSEKSPEELAAGAKAIFKTVLALQIALGAIQFLGSVFMAFGPLFTPILGGFRALGAVLGVGKGAAGGGILGGLRSLAGMFRGLGPAAGGGLLLLLALVADNLDHVWNRLTGVGQLFRSLGGLVSSLVGGGGSLSGLGSALGWVAGILGGLFDALSWVYDVLLTIEEIVIASFIIAFETLGGVITAVWEDYIYPAISAFDSWMKDKLGFSFLDVVEKMKGAWASLESAFAHPIRAFVNFVNDGIVDPMNTVLKNFGVEFRVSRISMPASLRDVDASTGLRMIKGDTVARAAGGVLPGYSPGHDNLTFYNPLLGLLKLSGGEGILRPEATVALGSDWVERVNRAARTGGVAGVRKEVGYADGGIIQWMTSLFRKAPAPASSAAPSTLPDLGAFLKGKVSKLYESALGAAVRESAVGRLILGGLELLVEKIAGGAATLFGADGGASAIAGGGGSLGRNAQQMLATLGPVIRQMGLRVTSVFRPGAVTAGYGTMSRHALNKAIDVAGPPAAMAAFARYAYANHLRELYELIYSPLNGVATVYRGRPYRETNPRTLADHYSHVHLAVFRKGGIIPGYTPGHDKAVFLNPLLGAYAFSGGEAVLRPEATLALGRQWVYGVNSAAEHGGVQGVRDYVGYADGGIYQHGPLIRDAGGMFRGLQSRSLEARAADSWWRATHPGAVYNVRVDVDRPRSDAGEIADEIMFELRKQEVRGRR